MRCSFCCCLEKKGRKTKKKRKEEGRENGDYGVRPFAKVRKCSASAGHRSEVITFIIFLEVCIDCVPFDPIEIFEVCKSS